ncbi:MAG: hypothetical protein QM538_05670 [Methylacidiphilales bacterium]|nr:hypothetical protein [Candidatus Methylacidiphilales bacterium]
MTFFHKLYAQNDLLVKARSQYLYLDYVSVYLEVPNASLNEVLNQYNTYLQNNLQALANYKNQIQITITHNIVNGDYLTSLVVATIGRNYKTPKIYKNPDILVSLQSLQIHCNSSAPFICQGSVEVVISSQDLAPYETSVQIQKSAFLKDSSLQQVYQGLSKLIEQNLSNYLSNQ